MYTLRLSQNLIEYLINTDEHYEQCLMAEKATFLISWA